MEELQIKTHNFEKSKAEIKQFSEQMVTDLDLKKVNSSKDVGEWFSEWFMGGGIGKDHKVTGSELNELIIQVQNNFIDMNNTQRKLINEFGQVYSALEALDKDYIQAILISIEATRKTNNKLEDSQKVIKTNQNNIKLAQEKIEKEGKILQKTVKVLQEFKEKLDEYKHMADIDEMWRELQDYAREISTCKNTISTLEQFKQRVEKIKHLSDVDKNWQNVQKHQISIEELEKISQKQTNLIKEHGESLNATKTVIDTIEHLVDIDKMWNDIIENEQIVNNLSVTLDKAIESINKQFADISSLKSSQNKISKQSHIYDVDIMWNNTNAVKENVDSLLLQMNAVSYSLDEQEKTITELIQKKVELDTIVHFVDVDEMFESFQRQDSDIGALKESISAQTIIVSKLRDELDEKDSKIAELKIIFSNKVKIAYILAGGSIGLAMIELILMLMRMI